jgi:hypothetical protein
MKHSLNLMTDEDRRAGILRESRRFWSRVLGITLVVLTCTGGAEWWHGRSATRRLAALESQYAPVQTLKDDCIRMRSEITTLRGAQQLTLRLVDTRPVVTLLGAISAAARETSGDVYVEELELKHEKTGSSNSSRVATVSGVGQTITAIAQFAAALRASDLFEEVSLESTESSGEHDGTVRSFQLECKL